MPIIPPDRANQLNSLVPTGYPYKLRGALLAKQDDPFQIPFEGLQPNFLYDLYVNDDRRRSFTSDANGDLLVTVDLEAGNDYEIRLFPFGGTDFGQRRIWVSVRNWATFHSASAEKILEVDESIGIIYDGLRLDSAAIDELNNYHGRNLLQGNDFNYGTGGFRETLRMLRQAYLNEGGSISGIRNAVASLAFINPLIKSGKDLSIWWLDEEISDEFRFSSRLLSNDLDSLNQHVLTGIGTISSISPIFGLSDITLIEDDNLRFQFSSGWDGGDIRITGTTKFGVDVEEVILSNPGDVSESVFVYSSIDSIVKTNQGSTGNVFIGYVNAKFIKVTNISPFTTPDVTNTLEYRPAPLPGIERYLYNGNIVREQSNSVTGVQTYRVYPPRVEAEITAVSVETYDLSGNARFFSFEIDGRGRVDMDFSNFVSTNISNLSAVTASEVVLCINDELVSRPNYGASYNLTASIVNTTAGDTFKISGNVNADSNIDFNGRDLGSFVKLYYSGNSNDFVNEVFQFNLNSTDSSRVFFGRQSDEWFDIEVNYEFKPTSNVSDNFDFLGSDGPDNLKISGLNTIGFRRTSLSFNRSLILEVTNSNWELRKSFPKVLEKLGKVITAQMIVSLGDSTLSITNPFSFFMSFDDGATFYSFNSVIGSQPTPNPIGTTDYELGAYHQTFTVKFYVPIDSQSAILKVRGNGFSSGDIIAIEDLSIFESSTTSKFLASNTVTRGPSYNLLRSELNVWFPERSNFNEREDIGLEDSEGHIQRTKPSNTIFDTNNATELNFTRRDPDTDELIGNSDISNNRAINVVGVWNAEQFENSTLTNFEVVPNSPRKSSFIRPENITDTGIIDVEFEEFFISASGNSRLIGILDGNGISTIPLNASGTASLSGDIVIPPSAFFRGVASGSLSLSGSSEADIVAIPPVASLTLDTVGTIHTNDTATFTATATSGSYPMNWTLTGSTLGVIDSGTWNSSGDSNVVVTSVLGNPSRTENFELEVSNSAGTSADNVDVTVTVAVDFVPNGAYSLTPQGDSFPIPITLPTGSDRGLFVLLTYDGTNAIPTHAQLGTTLSTLQCFSNIASGSLPDSERQCAIYYFSESDLAAGTTNNQLRFSDSLTPYSFPGDWSVHLYRLNNVGTITQSANDINASGSTLTTPVISMTEYSRLLSLSVALGALTATAVVGSNGSTSGGSGEIRSFEAIPNASGDLQIEYNDDASSGAVIGYCYVIVDPL